MNYWWKLDPRNCKWKYLLVGAFSESYLPFAPSDSYQPKTDKKVENLTLIRLDSKSNIKQSFSEINEGASTFPSYSFNKAMSLCHARLDIIVM